MSHMIKRTAAVILSGVFLLMGYGGGQEDKKEAYAIYEEFVRENFAENPTRQILADLDGDEKEEMILLADQTAADDPDNFQGTLKVFGILPGGQVNERYSTDVAENTAGWRWMYLYQREGETPVILEYSPQISAGMGPVILRFIRFSEEEWFYEEIDSFFWDSLHTSGGEREQMEQKKEEFAGTLEEYTRWALPLVMLGQDTAVTGESSAYFGGLFRGNKKKEGSAVQRVYIRLQTHRGCTGNRVLPLCGRSFSHIMALGQQARTARKGARTRCGSGKEKPMTNTIWRARKRNFLGLPWTFTIYGFSEDRLYIKTGILNTREDEVRLYRITDIGLERSLWQRIMGMGTIRVYSSDQSLGDFSLVNVKDCENVKEQLSQLIEAERENKRVSSREFLGVEDEGDALL